MNSESPFGHSSQKMKERFPRTCLVLEAGVSEGVAPGFVAGVWQAQYPDEMNVIPCGQRRIFPTPQPMLADTVFDLASVTKVFATATLAAALVDRGWLSWNTPVAAILPDFPHTNIEVRHLLSHTAGLVAWEPFWQKLWTQFAPTPLWQVPIRVRQKAMRELVFATPLASAPDQQCVYSDLSFLLLGFVLEELTHLPLDQAVKKWVWQPMGILGARYFHIDQIVAEGVLQECAATENCPTRGGVLQGQVHDDNCWAMGGFGGHAGAFAQASEVLHFSKKLFEGFLSRPTLEAMWTRVSMPVGCERTLGWDTPSSGLSSVGAKFSPRTVGHLGYTGTSLWIDQDQELAVTLLSNRVHPSRENTKIKDFRPRFHDAIRLDLQR
jgi:CubicO group peptidase (beta-lactamase class C family)